MSPSAPLLLIGTPAYGGLLHIDYVHSLLDFQRSGIPFTLATLGQESLVTRARNTIVAIFLAQPRATHLLFLDADVGLPASGLRTMLEAGCDVIGAPVPMKARDSAGRRIFNVGSAVGEAGGLLQVDRIGTGALLLSRRAVEALAQEAAAAGRVYARPRMVQEEAVPELHHEVFRTGVVDGQYVSEDYGACDTLRRLGFAIHVAPEVVTRHHGTSVA
jgi:hypothetical protein